MAGSQIAQIAQIGEWMDGWMDGLKSCFKVFGQNSFAGLLLLSQLFSLNLLSRQSLAKVAEISMF